MANAVGYQAKAAAAGVNLGHVLAEAVRATNSLDQGARPPMTAPSYALKMKLLDKRGI